MNDSRIWYTDHQDLQLVRFRDARYDCRMTYARIWHVAQLYKPIGLYAANYTQHSSSLLHISNHSMSNENGYSHHPPRNVAVGISLAYASNRHAPGYPIPTENTLVDIQARSTSRSPLYRWSTINCSPPGVNQHMPSASSLVPP